MDEGAVLREVATRQESRAALPLHLLGQRFGVLAGSPAFDAERIPLGPRALCRAMRDASQTLQVPYEARLLLYRIFDRQVMAGYSRVLERLDDARSEEHTSELQSLMRISYAVFCLKKKNTIQSTTIHTDDT